MLQDAAVTYVKHNRAKTAPGAREIALRMLTDFFATIESETVGLKGYSIMEGLPDPDDAMLLTFWESREAMDAFYSPANRRYYDFVEQTKRHLEQGPIRSDFRVVRFRFETG